MSAASQNNLTASLKDLRNSREKTIRAITSVVESGVLETERTDMFSLLGRTVGGSRETILLVLLIFLSVGIETGALILNAPIPPNRVKAASKEEGASNGCGNRWKVCPTMSYLLSYGIFNAYP
jgi:hypothetical protein